MTVALVFFTSVLLMALGLAWGLLRGLRPSQHPACLDLKPDPSRYRLLTQLMGRTEPGGLLDALVDPKPGRRHRRARRRLTRRCLREMRTAFLQVCSVCRLMAPYVDDPDFMTNVVREFFRFHVLYGRTHLRILLGGQFIGSVEIERLSNALGHLQQTAYAALPVN